ncbi:hypothetical protein P153DRAFT_253604, partial [Dothidotthia symphoricarpi CBS 119687]
YRIKLTLWLLDPTDRPKEPTKDEDYLLSRSTLIKKIWLSAREANDAAFDLAKACRSEGEVVLLVDRRGFGENDNVNEYAVGTWDWKAEGMLCAPDRWDLMLEIPHPFFKRGTQGVVSGVVQVLKEFPDGSFGHGGPVKSAPPRG